MDLWFLTVAVLGLTLVLAALPTLLANARKGSNRKK